MKKEPDQIRKQLDHLLAEISEKKEGIGCLKRAMDRTIAEATAQFEPVIKTAEEDLKAIEAELIGMAKYNKAELFGERDRVDLKHGALIRQVQRKVRRIKGMLERLQATGKTEAIKVAESVDWDKIEAWDDETLKVLGTKRVPKEIFEYEVKGSR